MNLLVLYLLMLKATITTFNGPMSLPVLRGELVTQRHVITDRELTAAVAAAQGSPGPMGIYVVGVGFFIAGVPGAIAGWLAMLTPAIVAVPLARVAARGVGNQRVRRAMDAAVVASAGLIAMSALPLAQASMHGALHYTIAAAAFAMAVFTRLPTVAILVAAGTAGVVSSFLMA